MKVTKEQDYTLTRRSSGLIYRTSVPQREHLMAISASSLWLNVNVDKMCSGDTKGSNSPHALTWSKGSPFPSYWERELFNEP